jgi:hypothetical protein
MLIQVNKVKGVKKKEVKAKVLELIEAKENIADRLWLKEKAQE